MGGFLNQTLNTDFRTGLYNLIVLAVKKSCELMVASCNAEGKTVHNHEEKIRNHLLENYLDKDEMHQAIGLANVDLRFLPEAPEHYESSSDTYSGRTDIKVVSMNWFNNRSDYYTIECKRIDGTLSLSKKYVTDGVCRFLGSPPLYPSHNKKNMMLAFVVNEIDQTSVLGDIALTHREKLKEHIVQDITILEMTSAYFLCESEYVEGLVLGHLFYDFSSIVA